MAKNIYDLSRSWFNFCFEQPEKISPNHTALYFFCIEHCNRLGWKEKFGLPTTMAKEAIGIRSYNTYKKTLDDLVEFGFITMVELSKNQYSSNIIALSNFDKAPDKAPDKALDKAMIKHVTKQGESTRQSIDSIDKQLYQYTNTPVLEIKKENFRSIEEYQEFREYEFSKLEETFLEALKLKIGIERPYCWVNRKMPCEYFDLVECLLKVKEDVEWQSSIQINNHINKTDLLNRLYEFVKEIKDSKIYLNYDGYDASSGKDNFITHFTRWLKVKLK